MAGPSLPVANPTSQPRNDQSRSIAEIAYQVPQGLAPAWLDPANAPDDPRSA